MGLSRLTAILIKTSKVNVETFQDCETQKYGFIISRMESGNYHELMRSKARSNRKKLAQELGEDYVFVIRDLTSET